MYKPPQSPRPIHVAFARLRITLLFVAAIAVSVAVAQFGGPDDPSGDPTQENPDDTVQTPPRRFFVMMMRRCWAMERPGRRHFGICRTVCKLRG